MTSYIEAHDEHIEASRKDPRSIEELIQIALTADEETARNAIYLLWYKPGQEILDATRLLLSSTNPEERIVGARILGQGGIEEQLPAEDTLPIFLSAMEIESDPGVLSTLCGTLGNIDDPGIVEPLVRWKNHPDEDVRFGVTRGLGGRREQAAVNTLIELTKDQDTDVRDWATFGLAQMADLDNAEIRSALWDRVSDEDLDVRGEALVGLAMRGDQSITEVLLQVLEEVGDDLGAILFEAAVEAGKHFDDPRICQVVRHLETLSDHFGFGVDLQEALSKCNEQ